MIRNQIEIIKVYEDLGIHESKWQNLPAICSKLRPPAHITVNCDLDEISIFADPMLEKAFFNLLDNSIRHGDHVTGIRVSSHPADTDLIVV